eukprot:3452152-Amphidinium_carterae.1
MVLSSLKAGGRRDSDGVALGWEAGAEGGSHGEGGSYPLVGRCGAAEVACGHENSLPYLWQQWFWDEFEQLGQLLVQ